jgi:mono/diheme cytochrome c family protein
VRTLKAHIAILLVLTLALPTFGLAEGASAEMGEAVYRNNCALCHQTGAQGLAGQFPRLTGRIAAIAATPAGREYLIDVLLNGMAGRITVDDTPIQGVMPSFRTLSDEQIAAVLSYLAGLPPRASKPVRFRVSEPAALRQQPQIAPTAMRERREELHRAGAVP